jgi:hypothetical protein
MLSRTSVGALRYSLPLSATSTAAQRHRRATGRRSPTLRRSSGTALAPRRGGGLGAASQSWRGWTPRLPAARCLRGPAFGTPSSGRRFCARLGAAPQRFARGNPLRGLRRHGLALLLPAALSVLMDGCSRRASRRRAGAASCCSHPRSGFPRANHRGAVGCAPHCATGGLGAALRSATAFGLPAHRLWLPPPEAGPLGAGAASGNPTLALPLVAVTEVLQPQFAACGGFVRRLQCSTT